jgi:transposase
VGHPHASPPGAPRAERPGADRPGRAAPAARALAHVDALEAEISELVAKVAPQLLAEPGFGPLTAGKLIGEIAGVERFSSDAKLARAGGIAPIPVSSGKTNRHRLDRGGNRQINTAIHRVAVTRARCHPENPRLHRTQALRRQDQRDAIRCLKRHLARRVWLLLQPQDLATRPSTI